MAAVTASSMSSPVSGGAAAIVASLLSRPPVGLAREAKGENPTSDQPHPSAIRGTLRVGLARPRRSAAAKCLRSSARPTSSPTEIFFVDGPLDARTVGSPTPSSAWSSYLRAARSKSAQIGMYLCYIHPKPAAATVHRERHGAVAR